MAAKKEITFRPSEPIKHGDETYEALTFQRLKVRHMVAMDKVDGDLRKMTAMFASMAGVPVPVIDELDADDFERLSREIAPLLGNSARSLMEKPAPDEGDAAAMH